MADDILGGEMNPFAGNDLPDLVDGIDWNEVWRYRMEGWFRTVNGTGEGTRGYLLSISGENSTSASRTGSRKWVSGPRNAYSR